MHFVRPLEGTSSSPVSAPTTLPRPVLALILALALGMFAGHDPALADTYYLSSDGDDQAIGSIDLPLATLREAVSRAKRSATEVSIFLKRGQSFSPTVIDSDGRLDGLTIGAYGEGRLPRIIGPGGIQTHSEPINRLTIQDIHFIAGLKRPDDPRSEDGGISIVPASRGYRLTIQRVIIVGGDEGIHVVNYENVLFERVLVTRALAQGILIGGVKRFVMLNSAVVYCGWRQGMEGEARDTYRDHGIYANQRTTEVVFDRVIVAHNNNCGWKAENGGILRNSLFLGNPCHLGLGGGYDEANGSLPIADRTFKSEGNVYAAATDALFGNLTVVTASHPDGGMGSVVFRNDLVGPPVTSDGRTVRTPWGGRNKFLFFRFPGTPVLGYGVPSRTSWPRWASLERWNNQVARWVSEGGITPQIIDREREAARLAILPSLLETQSTLSTQAPDESE